MCPKGIKGPKKINGIKMGVGAKANNIAVKAPKPSYLLDKYITPDVSKTFSPVLGGHKNAVMIIPLSLKPLKDISNKIGKSPENTPKELYEISPEAMAVVKVIIEGSFAVKPPSQDTSDALGEYHPAIWGENPDVFGTQFMSFPDYEGATPAQGPNKYKPEVLSASDKKDTNNGSVDDGFTEAEFNDLLAMLKDASDFVHKAFLTYHNIIIDPENVREVQGYSNSSVVKSMKDLASAIPNVFGNLCQAIIMYKPGRQKILEIIDKTNGACIYNLSLFLQVFKTPQLKEMLFKMLSLSSNRGMKLILTLEALQTLGEKYVIPESAKIENWKDVVLPNELKYIFDNFPEHVKKEYLERGLAAYKFPQSGEFVNSFIEITNGIMKDDSIGEIQDIVLKGIEEFKYAHHIIFEQPKGSDNNNGGSVNSPGNGGADGISGKSISAGHITSHGQKAALLVDGIVIQGEGKSPIKYLFVDLYLTVKKTIDGDAIAKSFAEAERISYKHALMFAILQATGDKEYVEKLDKIEKVKEFIESHFKRIYGESAFEQMPEFGVWANIMGKFINGDEKISWTDALSDLQSMTQKSLLEVLIEGDNIRFGPLNISRDFVLTIIGEKLEEVGKRNDLSEVDKKKFEINYDILTDPDIPEEEKIKYFITFMFQSKSSAYLQGLANSIMQKGISSIADFVIKFNKATYQDLKSDGMPPPITKPLQTSTYNILNLDKFIGETLTRIVFPENYGEPGADISFTLFKTPKFLGNLSTAIQTFMKIVSQLNAEEALEVANKYQKFVKQLAGIIGSNIYDQDLRVLIADLYVQFAGNDSVLNEMQKIIQGGKKNIETEVPKLYKKHFSYADTILGLIAEKNKVTPEEKANRILDKQGRVRKQINKMKYLIGKTGKKGLGDKFEGTIIQALINSGNDVDIFENWFDAMLVDVYKMKKGKKIKKTEFESEQMFKEVLAYLDKYDPTKDIGATNFVKFFGKYPLLAGKKSANIAITGDMVHGSGLPVESWQNLADISGGFLSPKQLEAIISNFGLQSKISLMTTDKANNLIKNWVMADEKKTIENNFSGLAQLTQILNSPETLLNAFEKIVGWADGENKDNVDPYAVRKLLVSSIESPEIIESLLILANKSLEKNNGWLKSVMDEVSQMYKLFDEKGNYISGDVLGTALRGAKGEANFLSANSEIDAVKMWGKEGYSINIVPTDPNLERKSHDFDAIDNAGNIIRVEVKSKMKKNGELDYIEMVTKQLIEGAKQLEDAGSGKKVIQLYILGDGVVGESLKMHISYLLEGNGKGNGLSNLDGIRVVGINIKDGVWQLGDDFTFTGKK